MPTVKPSLQPLDVRRLTAAADRAGDANGVATGDELKGLAASAPAPTAFETNASARTQRLQTLIGESARTSWRTLDTQLTSLPAPLRRLALEIDGLWGNSDGQVSAAEFDRVAHYYLAALPFFTDRIDELRTLAGALGFSRDLAPELFDVTQPQSPSGAEFRALFDAAVSAADVPGAPQWLRDVRTHDHRWHRLSILEHSAFASRTVAELSRAVGIDWTAAAATMLLHDVGKILDRQPDGVGGFDFKDHEGQGARWLEQRGLPEEMVFLIRHHSVLRKMDERAFVELAGGDPDRLAKMLVVYVADQVAKGDTADQLQSLSEQRPKIERLCAVAGIDAQQLLSAAVRLRDEVVAQAERAAPFSTSA